ncbi:MAG: rhodanese-like domain-containing protein [Magnetococcus sp. YQC-5]
MKNTKIHLNIPYPSRWWQPGLLVALLLLWFICPGQAWALTFPKPLIEPMWLYEHLNEVVILDVRDDPESFLGRRRTQSGKVFNPCGVTAVRWDAPVFGHIPGAVLIPWSEIMVERRMEGDTLQQMVPDPQAFQALMRRAGVNNDSAVVIVGRGMSDPQMAMATRLFWTMRYYGHTNLALLNGGTSGWIAKNRRIRFNNPQPKPGNFTVKPDNTALLATTAEMEQFVKNGSWQIVDVRGRDYFEGLARVDKWVSSNGEGHIPTARHLPVASLMRTTKGPAIFLHPQEIKAIANKHQVSTTEPTAFYCNVGLQGSLAWFIWHEILGNHQTRLYDGSMHAWSRNPDREVEGF